MYDYVNIILDNRSKSKSLSFVSVNYVHIRSVRTRLKVSAQMSDFTIEIFMNKSAILAVCSY